MNSLPLISLVLLCVGCGAAALPQRYPSRPPVGMTAAQAGQDENVCVVAAADATAERAWTYISCMVSKGHTVGVAFHVHASPTYLGVTQTRPHDPLVIVAELEECRRFGYTAGRSEGGTRDMIVDRMEAAFRRCLDPRGYAVQRQAEPAAATPRR